MPQAERYSLHGLLVESELPLVATGGHRTRPASLRVVLGASRAVPRAPASGTLLAFEPDPDGFAVTHTACEHTLRYYGLCEFQFVNQTGALNVHLDPTADPAIAQLLLSSSVLAYWLELQGQCVLHASAVSHQGQALAFIGPSGAGKSSFAASLCSEGWLLISDDALHCDLTEYPQCSSGTHELRMRPCSASLAALFDKRYQTPTADDRIAIHALGSPHDKLPISALVAPRLGAALSLQRETGKRALATLLTAVRTVSWCCPSVAHQQLQHLATLARRVPVFSLTAPPTLLDSSTGRSALRDAVRALLPLS